MSWWTSEESIDKKHNTIQLFVAIEVHCGWITEMKKYLLTLVQYYQKQKTLMKLFYAFTKHLNSTLKTKMHYLILEYYWLNSKNTFNLSRFSKRLSKSTLIFQLLGIILLLHLIFTSTMNKHFYTSKRSYK